MFSETTLPKKSCPLNQCADGQGKLPCCGQLAVPYVPFQPEDPEVYQRSEALAQGTLFPGLNLPFHLKPNGDPVPQTPLSELQALEFVLVELGLYLTATRTMRKPSPCSSSTPPWRRRATRSTRPSTAPSAGMTQRRTTSIPG